MIVTGKASRRYIAEVQKRLKCSSKKRRDFLNTLEPELYNFELSHPDAGYAEYVSAFNTPQYTAGAYMEELSSKERVMHYMPYICTAVLLIVGAFAFLLALFVSQVEGFGGYYVVYTTQVISYSDDSDGLVTDIGTDNEYQPSEDDVEAILR